MTTPLNQLIQDTIFSTDCRPGHPEPLIHSIHEAHEAVQNDCWIAKTLEKTYNFSDEEKEQIAEEVRKNIECVFTVEVDGDTYTIDFAKDEIYNQHGYTLGDAEFLGSIPHDAMEFGELLREWNSQTSEM